MALGKQGTGARGEKVRESLGPYFSLASLGWAGEEELSCLLSSLPPLLQPRSHVPKGKARSPEEPGPGKSWVGFLGQQWGLSTWSELLLPSPQPRHWCGFSGNWALDRTLLSSLARTT